jgi:choline dehydrogenase
MARFDYVIVGAGPAGCVLANRLSADPRVEAASTRGGWLGRQSVDRNAEGIRRAAGRPRHGMAFPDAAVRARAAGRALGARQDARRSSAINGMAYNRGARADYDAVERLGNPGWGWHDMLPVFKQIEDNELGGSEVRGAGGPLHVSTVDEGDPLLEDVIAAGTRLGWRRMRDLNETDEERIGYAMSTIRDGRRVSAANAFLHPVIDCPNLTVALHTLVDRVELRGRRAVGVRGRRDGRAVEAHATRDVILATAASPHRGSSSAPASVPRTRCEPPASTSWSTARTSAPDCASTACSCCSSGSPKNSGTTGHSAPRPAGVQPSWSTGRRGEGRRRRPHSTSSPSSRPARSLIAPTPRFRSRRSRCCRPSPERSSSWSAPGMLCVGFILRPDSEGSVQLTSADPDAPPDIDANYFATEHDRTTAVGVFRAMRRMFATGPLSRRIARETVPGHGVKSEQQIIDAGLTTAAVATTPSARARWGRTTTWLTPGSGCAG